MPHRYDVTANPKRSPTSLHFWSPMSPATSPARSSTSAAVGTSAREIGRDRAEQLLVRLWCDRNQAGAIECPLRVATRWSDELCLIAADDRRLCDISFFMVYVCAPDNADGTLDVHAVGLLRLDQRTASALVRLRMDESSAG